MHHRLLALALPCLLAACGDGSSTPTSPDSTGTAPQVSYYADVKPILDRACVSCHQDGQIGLGQLTDYASAGPRAGVIAQQVADRVMPPWLAADGCNEYVGERGLSDAEIATLVAWAEDGAPAGDPKDAVSTKQTDPPELDRVDHLLALPEPYQPDTSHDDDYRCFVIDWPEQGESFVTGFGVRVDNTSTVHHLIAYIAPPAVVAEVEALDAADSGPGYDCFGGPGTGVGSGTGFFGAWAPGVLDNAFADGTGIRVEAGSKIVVQMHYNALSWNGDPDQTAVAVRLDSQVEREARFQFWTNPSWVTDKTMNIPAGDPDVEHSFAYDPTPFVSDDKPLTIYGVALHMHTRGTSGRLAIERGGGGSECLLDIPRWDFDWQFGYGLKTPTVVNPGDQLYIECHWDNSPENQPIVDGSPMPPSELNWGDGTNDEMCLGSFFIVPDP